MSAINAISSFIQSVILGETDPGPTHAVLIGLCILGSLAVAFGIILESWPPKSCKAVIAMVAVIGGVVLEGAFTIVLFVYDEAVSSSQQAKIISLETRASPRFLTEAFGESLKGKESRPVRIAYMRDVSDGHSFAMGIWSELDEAHWPVSEPVPIPSPRFASSPYLDSLIAKGALSGVNVLFGPGGPGGPAPAISLQRAFSKGLPPMEGTMVMGDPDLPEKTILVVVGPKP